MHLIVHVADVIRMGVVTLGKTEQFRFLFYLATFHALQKLFCFLMPLLNPFFHKLVGWMDVSWEKVEIRFEISCDFMCLTF